MIFKIKHKLKRLVAFFVERYQRKQRKLFDFWLLNEGKGEESFSQCKQDLFVKYYFSSTKKDFFIFVDIGANDGMTFSNTMALEKSNNQKWRGICIEADPEVYSLLKKNRPNAFNYNIALCDKDGEVEFCSIKGPQMLSGILSEYDPRHMERIKREIQQQCGKADTITIPSARFDTILKNHPEIETIDYLSIDVEGAEMKILENINFEEFDITLIDIEDNYNDPKLIKFFKERGYRPLIRLDADLFFEKCKKL